MSCKSCSNDGSRFVAASARDFFVERDLDDVGISTVNVGMGYLRFLKLFSGRIAFGSRKASSP